MKSSERDIKDLKNRFPQNASKKRTRIFPIPACYSPCVVFTLWSVGGKQIYVTYLLYFAVFIQVLVIGHRTGRHWTGLPWLRSHLLLFFAHLPFCNCTCIFLYSRVKGPTRGDNAAVFFWFHSTAVNHWRAAKWFRHGTARWDWRGGSCDQL